MKKVEISDLGSFVGEKVVIHGFIDSIRDLKKYLFIVVRDLDYKVQVFIYKDKNNTELVNQVLNMTVESTVEVLGILVDNPHVKLNGYEIIPEKISLISGADTPLPLDASSPLHDRLDWRFLDLRRAENLLIFQLQTFLEMSMRQFFIEQGFLEIHSPKLIGAASESGAELFSVKYFDRLAYLAQSPQFYKQMAMASGFNKVFEIGPVFRANPSFTSRHDTEFTSVDAELSWIESHEDIMRFEERWIAFIISNIKAKFGDRIKESFGVDLLLPTVPFPRVSMKDALAIVKSAGHNIPKEYEGELDPDGEKIVCDHYKKLGYDFLFITGYPSEIRPFYHMREEGGETKSFDLLFKGVEITTGAQREHRLQVLTNQALEKNISLKSINFYLDFFRYGMPPHGGFGFGLTRFIMLLLGLNNVRQVTYIYRGPNRLFP